jgi:hypothetical protein
MLHVQLVKHRSNDHQAKCDWLGSLAFDMLCGCVCPCVQEDFLRSRDREERSRGTWIAQGPASRQRIDNLITCLLRSLLGDWEAARWVVTPGKLRIDSPLSDVDKLTWHAIPGCHRLSTPPYYIIQVRNIYIYKAEFVFFGHILCTQARFFFSLVTTGLICLPTTVTAQLSFWSILFTISS